MTKEEKRHILSDYDKGEFTNFLQFSSDDKILELFDDEGIIILDELTGNHLREDRFRYLFTYKARCANILFQNEKYVSYFLSLSFGDCYGSLMNLNKTSCDNIVNYMFDHNFTKEDISLVISFFSEEWQCNFIQNDPRCKQIGNELFLKIMKSIPLQMLIKNGCISLEKYKSNQLVYHFVKIVKERKISLPQSYLTYGTIEKLLKAKNLAEVRSFVDDLSYVTDTSKYIEYIKNYEEDCLDYASFNDGELYEVWKILSDSDILRALCTYPNFTHLSTFAHICSKEEFEEKVMDQNDKIISYYIIDYHFEANPLNILKDIAELVNYHFSGEGILSYEKLDLYQRILNINNMTFSEKMALHAELKNYNIIEMFYDDMARARYRVNEDIKEYSLSSDTITAYEDSALSEKYGVPVYLFDGEPFYAIAKSGMHSQAQKAFGRSYSLIGYHGFHTYIDPEEADTYIYDSNVLNPLQIVHLYPFDSFSAFNPDIDDYASDRVNMLMTPEDLTTESLTYNEIVLLEAGKEETGISKDIPFQKRIAVLCLDEIKPEHIQSAKKENIGIMLIKTRCYEQLAHNRRRKGLVSETDRYVDGFEEAKTNYFNAYLDEIEEEITKSL